MKKKLSSSSLFYLIIVIMFEIPIKLTSFLKNILFNNDRSLNEKLLFAHSILHDNAKNLKIK